eukprot:6184660-Heterocapsa_arctica.AAC.1
MQCAAPPNCARDAIHNGFTAPSNAFELTHRTLCNATCCARHDLNMFLVWTQLEDTASNK